MVVIINYGVGNMASLTNALRYLGIAHEVASDAKSIANASRLVLPGVGAFATGIGELKKRGLVAPILDAIARPDTRLFGICLGMQLLFEGSEEGGGEPGLGILKGTVRHLPAELGANVPHVGFDSIHFAAPSRLSSGLKDGTDFYFTHSYAVQDSIADGWSAWFQHGSQRFLAAVERDGVAGVQFHPEKSQSNGLKLLGNALC